MSEKIVMPLLGSSMEEGLIVEWLKQEGDNIEQGDPLLKVETDKAVLEAESHYQGTVFKILVDEGEKAEVGQTIGIVLEEGENPEDIEMEELNKNNQSSQSEIDTDESTTETTTESTNESGEDERETRDKADNDRIFVTPVAKKMAKAKELDLNNINGSGPSGRIIKSDIEDYLEQNDNKKIEEITLTPIRRKIAERTQSSMQERPHYYVSNKIKMNKVLEMQQKLKEGKEISFSINDFFLKAVALVLNDFPLLNSSYNEERGVIEVYQEKNIGMVVATDDGMLIPVVHNADKLSLSQIARTTTEYVDKVKNDKINSEMMNKGTFTVSNLGMFGISEFKAVINPPESAILAIGGIEKQLSLSGEKVVENNIIRVNLSLDHRVIDGVTGAKYLQKLKELMENPVRILV